MIKIATIAENYFLFKPSVMLRYLLKMALSLFQKAKAESYDLIFIDAFTEDYVPSSFLTLDFVLTSKRF